MPWWFPGAGFKRNEGMYCKKVVGCIEKPFAVVEMAVVCSAIPIGKALPHVCVEGRGDASSSATASLIERESNTPKYDRDMLRWVAGVMFLGGADTVSQDIVIETVYPNSQRPRRP